MDQKKPLTMVGSSRAFLKFINIFAVESLTQASAGNVVQMPQIRESADCERPIDRTKTNMRLN